MEQGLPPPFLNKGLRVKALPNNKNSIERRRFMSLPTVGSRRRPTLIRRCRGSANSQRSRSRSFNRPTGLLIADLPPDCCRFPNADMPPVYRVGWQSRPRGREAGGEGNFGDIMASLSKRGSDHGKSPVVAQREARDAMGDDG
jgi:hypothetical protein